MLKTLPTYFLLVFPSFVTFSKKGRFENGLWAILLLFSLPTNLFSQQKWIGQTLNQGYVVEQFTLAQGLSDNEVNAMLQDRKGFIWIGTNDGLNRYDGYSFRIFKHQPDNPGSLSNNKINALLEDKKGRLWVATNQGLNLFDPRTETFRRFQHDPANAKSISHDEIRAIFEDESGVLWVGAYNGLVKFNEADQTFSLFRHQATHFRHWETEPSHQIWAIGATPDGKLMVGYWGMGIMIFDKSSETFRQIKGKEAGDFNYLTTDWIEPVKNGRVWVVASGRLFEYSPEYGLVEHDLKIFQNKGKAFKAFVQTKSGLYLALSDNGLYVLNQNLQVKQHLIPAPAHPISPLHNWATTGIEDHAGDFWFGTSGSGIFRLSTKDNQFTNFHYQPTQPGGIQHHNINSIMEMENGSVWVGSRRHGITTFIKYDNRFVPMPPHIQYPRGLNTNEISVLHEDSRGDIWIGTWGGGINVYNPKTRSFRYFSENLNDSTTLSSRFVTDIFETAEGEIWVGTIFGVSILYSRDDIEKGHFKQLKPPVANSFNSINIPDPFFHVYVHCIYQTKAGQIWVGTSRGLYRFDRAGRRFISVDLYPNDIGSTGQVTIYDILEDGAGHLWFGTTQGLSRFDPRSNSFVHYTEKESLPDGIVVGIETDNNGHIWLATKTGISTFDPASGQFKNYGARDGLENHSFNPDAFIFSKSRGIIFAGGKNGLTLFHPDSIRPNPYVPPVYITASKKYQEKGGATKEIVVGGIAFLDELVFSYQENIIVFELTALNFRNAAKNQYAYQLEGFDDNWINIGTRREITFTNLSPGQYTLRVKASNNDGLWNEAGTSLKIIIKPPWWATWWAYALYALALGTLFYLLRRYELNRQILKSNLKVEKLEAEKLKELDHFKTRLYTNLTHEFRTPLTVILGMASQIRSEPKKYIDEGTRLIETNGQNLLHLINQLLDLSKLENKSFQLHLQQGDIVPYLRYVTESFQTYANHKNLSLRFFTTLESLEMDYDPEQIKQVLTNLISNALKFTPSSGEVKVKLALENDPERLRNFQSFANVGEGGLLKIEVLDTGIGISEKDLPHIFDRFYQVDGSHTREGEGTGIGLAHTQELVKVMGGEIGVESEVGKGSTFLVRLPITKNASQNQGSPNYESLINLPEKNQGLPNYESLVNLPEMHDSSLGAHHSELPQLLIIEDNPDVVVYLKTCLNGLYQLDVAYNGQIGIEKALENIPDLIVSDVMMPEKDGYQVCDTLKNDERTSHIPIILLTAKADAASKITGLKRGADAYLTKPFDKEELLVRLEMLVERQKRMAAYFSKNLLSGTAPVSNETEEAIQVEDAFMQKVRQIVEDNYSDEGFALPQLCQKIGMSRSQLFRKMQALSDTSPSDFIRSYRLYKAKTLLETTDLSVSEVAWQVGFKDLSHFSKSFQDAFKSLPSEINK